MYKSKLIVILLVLVLLQLSVCSKQKKEQEQELQISPQEDLQLGEEQEQLPEEIQVEEETPDTFQIEEISYLPSQVLKIKKINMPETEGKLSPPIEINYINWDGSWTPKREELPAAIFWNFFDSSQVKHFNPEEVNALVDYGFFVEKVPVKKNLWVDDMVDLYDELFISPEDIPTFKEKTRTDFSIVPVFISTDLLLHVYHLLFDHALQDIEQKKFLPLVVALNSKLYTLSKQYYETAIDSLIKKAALMNEVYFAVAAKLLTTKVFVAKEKLWWLGEVLQAGDVLNDAQIEKLKRSHYVKYGGKNAFERYVAIYQRKPLKGEVVPEDVKNLVEAEHSLIMNAKGFSSSPLFGPDVEEDYSQYRPRGHYTMSENLKSYFRVMMWFGRMPFSVDDKRATMQAILITHALQNPEVENYWSALMNSIDFLIGEQEDLSVHDYRQILQDVYGTNPSLEEIADSLKLDLFRQKAKNLTKKRIAKAVLSAKMPEKAFRFMGQRFIPDAEIFSKLTTPRVGTEYRPRLMPKPIEVMAVLGSSLADRKLNKDKLDIPFYVDSLDALKTHYQRLPEREWQRTTYWCWLNTLRPLLQEKDHRYPFFMRNINWCKKSLLTALSSWGELKHDTILYSVQAYSELGEEPEIPPKPPQPKGYVEPDLEFFNRLIYMVEKTFRTLEAANLISDEYRQKMAEYLAKINSLRQIVRKELLNEEISDTEYDLISHLSQDFRWLVRKGIEVLSYNDEPSKKMAVVADVHTDARNKKVLTVGIGTPQRIYVAVKDRSGGARITVGYIFSYYEFPQPMDKRMTDEEWRALVYGGVDILDKEPDWIGELRRYNKN